MQRMFQSFLVLSCSFFCLINCSKEKDKTTTPAATSSTDSSAADFSDESFDEDARAIIPIGTLAVTLLTSASGTPCRGDNEGDSAEPENGTFECTIAKLFADPEIYEVGQEGVLSGLPIVDKVFKPAATATCDSPLLGDDQDVTGPIFPETRKFSCGMEISPETLMENFKTSGIPPFEDMTDAQINAMMEAHIFNAYIYWGETGETGAKVKNLMALTDFEPNASELALLGGTHEKGVWRFQKDTATGDFEISISSIWDNEQYQSRYSFTGNTQTHEFEVVMRRGNVVETTDSLDVFMLKGKGISQGEGNYFMLKMMGDRYSYEETPYDIDSELTLCISAETHAIVENSYCSDYEDALDSMDYLEKTDLPDEYTDFPYSALD